MNRAGLAGMWRGFVGSRDADGNRNVFQSQVSLQGQMLDEAVLTFRKGASIL